MYYVVYGIYLKRNGLSCPDFILIKDGGLKELILAAAWRCLPGRTAAICLVDTAVLGLYLPSLPSHRLLSSLTKAHLRWLFGMAANYVFDALIPYTADITIIAPEDLPVSRPHGKWALLLDSLLNPSPGRTLDRVYTSLGKVLEKQANRAAHSLGLGPHVVAQKIKSFFGIGEERVQHLELLRISIPAKLDKNCWRLMRYTLPYVFHLSFDI
jgi:hypothetical protein